MLMYIIPAWLVTTAIVYGIKRGKSDKIKVMSCRQILRKYHRLDAQDSKTIF